MTFDWPQQHLPGRGLREWNWPQKTETEMIFPLRTCDYLQFVIDRQCRLKFDSQSQRCSWFSLFALFFGISHDTRRVSRNFIMNISWKYHEQQLSQQWAMNSKSLLSDLSTIECSIWWKINKLIPLLNCNYYSHKSNFYLVYYCCLLCDFRNFLLKTHCESSHKNSKQVAQLPGIFFAASLRAF